MNRRQVRANKAGCLEQCEHGPTVAIFPQGIFYGGVMVEDVLRIIEKTIFHQCDDTIRGHVFCSFLALLLMKENCRAECSNEAGTWNGAGCWTISTNFRN